jgi:hypothetical protein
MALLSIKASKKIDTTIRLEEATAKKVDRYAHLLKVSPDDVVNEALEYIFAKDKEFQQHLHDHPDVSLTTGLRVKKPAPSVVAARNARKNSAANALKVEK